jgi:hypothetical protein
MALTTRNVLAQCLRELIKQRIASRKDDLAYGGGILTLEAYREVVGELRGLNDALDLVDEAERLTEERERGV